MFVTNDNITREQIVVILYNYARYKGNDVTNRADLSAFTDSSKISFWAEDAMMWTVGEKRITDMTATTFFPDGNATRAQVAGILMRFTNE